MNAKATYCTTFLKQSLKFGSGFISRTQPAYLHICRWCECAGVMVCSPCMVDDHTCSPAHVAYTLRWSNHCQFRMRRRVLFPDCRHVMIFAAVCIATAISAHSCASFAWLSSSCFITPRRQKHRTYQTQYTTTNTPFKTQLKTHKRKKQTKTHKKTQEDTQYIPLNCSGECLMLMANRQSALIIPTS